MKSWMVFLTVGVLALSAPARADITGVTEGDDGTVAGVNVQPIRGGNWEITPILTLRFTGKDLFYRGGVSVAYAFNRYHQIGGSFVMGNREYDRLGPRNQNDVGQAVGNEVQNVNAQYLTIDQSFGSSASAFYRLNLPLQIEKRTFPYLEVFGGHDFWGWGNVSEVGGLMGVRKLTSRRTALTAGYGVSVLFSHGEHIRRQVVTAGVSVFF